MTRAGWPGRWEVPLILAILTALVYGSSLSHEFVWDDFDLVVSNPAVTELQASSWFELFTSEFAVSGIVGRTQAYYRPVSVLSLAIDHRIWGLSAAGFHLTNLVLHFTTSWLVVLLLIEIGIRRIWSTAAGVLFVLHPVHTEPVLWVSGRTDLLTGLFGVSTILLYLRTVNGKRWAAWSGVGALGTCALAILSKEMGLAVPMCVGLLVLLNAGRSLAPRRSRSALLLFLGMLAIVPLLAFLRSEALEGRSTAAVVDAPSLGQRLLGAPRVVSRAARLLVYPDRLAPDQPDRGPRARVSLADPLTYGSLLGLGVFLAAAFHWRRRRPWFGFGLLFFLVSLSPVLGFVPLNIPFAERYLYFPSVAFVGLLARIGQSLTMEKGTSGGRQRWHMYVWIAMGVLAVLYAGRTTVQKGVWRNDLTLFSHLRDLQPDSPNVLNELGIALGRRGRLDEAREVLERAIALSGSNPLAHYNLGLVLERTGDFEEAARTYARILGTTPDAKGVPRRLANLLDRIEHRDAAVRALEQASRRGSEEAKLILEELVAQPR